MPRFICYWLVVISTFCHLYQAAALYCFTCENEEENWRCDENEPVKCSDKDSVCVTLGTDIFTKGCKSDCSRSRGDSDIHIACKSCRDDFCNSLQPGSNISVSNSDILHHDTIYHGDTRYILYAETLTFWEARASCIRKGGILANIHSKEIQDFIVNSVLNDSHAEGIMEVRPFSGPDSRGIWIGLYRTNINSQGNFSWIWTDDGGIVSSETEPCDGDFRSYENWDAAPSQENGRLCGYLTRKGKWKPFSCGKRVSWILCEHHDGPTRQSFVKNDTIYTYKYRFVNPNNTDIACDKNMIEVTAGVTTNLLADFGFVHDNFINRKSVWCNKSDSVDKTKRERVPADCKETNHYIICRKSLLSDCSSQNNGSTDSGKDNSAIDDSCNQHIHHNEHENFHFDSTSTEQYAASQETCSDGRPKAIIWCAVNRSFTEFDQIPCEMTFLDALSEIKNISNDDTVKASLAEIQKLNFLSLQNVEILSHQYLASVETAMKGVLDEATPHGEALPIIVEIISDLQKRMPGMNNHRHRSISNSSTSSAEMKKYFVKLLESSAAEVKLTSNDSRKEFSAEDVVVEIVPLNEGDSTSVSMSHKSSDNQAQIRVFPGSSLVNSRSTNEIRVVFAIYNGDELFPTDDEDIHVDAVVSATVTDGVNTYSVPVEFSFQITSKLNFSKGTCQRRECRYYDQTTEKWKQSGCRKVKETNDGWGIHTITCSCDHTTSFAVVVSQHAQQNHALDVASTIGLVACVICLTVTVILFLTTPDLKKIRCGFIHTNLCICLDLSYLVFLIGIEQTNNRYACLLTAAMIHFFLVSSWGWMAVESVTMYRMFVRPLSKKSVAETPKVAYAVYMTSAAVVLLTLSFSVLAQYQGWGDGKGCSDDHWSSYVADGYCWLQGRSLYFGFLSIAFIALAVNTVLAALIIKAITWRKSDVPTRAGDTPQMQIMRALLIAMLLGLAWVFAVPLVISDNAVVQNVFGWLFAVTTSVQGLFIFYFFCIRRKDVRYTWVRCLRRVVKFKNRHSVVESGIGLRGARTESFLYLPNTSRNLYSTSEEMQKTTT